MTRFSYTKNDLKKVPERPERSNKGTFGRVLVVGGSVNMSGAAYFAAKAAYRSGAGLVQLLSPEENRIIYQSQLPEALFEPYNFRDPDESAIKNAVCRASAVAIGIGLGTSDTAKKILRLTLESATAPLVIDADALNLLAVEPSLWELVPQNSIITPHPAEMSRISGLRIDEICADITSTAEKFARDKNVICILKDHRTAVSDGMQTMINACGCSALATGGSGDVLAGIIAALLAQGAERFEAASLGVFIHATAGDLAAERLSKYSVMASDVIELLPEVFKLR